MTNDHLVSVIVPTRDRPAMLLRALQSIRMQTYRNHEIVVVDDASLIPVEDITRGIPNCRIVRNPRALGPAACRNLGAHHARGDLLAFLDDDDWYLPLKLERSLACLLTHPSAVALFHRVAWGSTDSDTAGGCTLIAAPVKRMLLAQPPHVDGLLIWAEVHFRVKFDETFAGAADLDYCLRLAQQGPMVDLDHILAQHGDAPNSFIQIERRIEGRKLFAKKHEQLLRGEAGASAYHQIRLGHLYLRAGRRPIAVASFLRAALSQPTLKLVWSGLGQALLPKQLYRGLVGTRHPSDSSGTT